MPARRKNFHDPRQLTFTFDVMADHIEQLRRENAEDDNAQSQTETEATPVQQMPAAQQNPDPASFLRDHVIFGTAPPSPQAHHAAEPAAAQAAQPEQTAAPEETPAAKLAHLLGVNSKRDTIYETGVGGRRFYETRKGIVATQTITDAARNAWDSPEILFSKGEHDFLTTDEVRRFAAKQRVERQRRGWGTLFSAPAQEAPAATVQAEAPEDVPQSLNATDEVGSEALAPSLPTEAESQHDLDAPGQANAEQPAPLRIETHGRQIYVTGNTLEHKDRIKAIPGRRWEKKKGAWTFLASSEAEVRAALKDLLEPMRARPEPSVDAAKFESVGMWAHPESQNHYHWASMSSPHFLRVSAVLMRDGKKDASGNSVPWNVYAIASNGGPFGADTPETRFATAGEAAAFVEGLIAKAQSVIEAERTEDALEIASLDAESKGAGHQPAQKAEELDAETEASKPTKLRFMSALMPDTKVVYEPQEVRGGYQLLSTCITPRHNDDYYLYDDAGRWVDAWRVISGQLKPWIFETVEDALEIAYKEAKSQNQQPADEATEEAVKRRRPVTEAAAPSNTITERGDDHDRGQDRADGNSQAGTQAGDGSGVVLPHGGIHLPDGVDIGQVGAEQPGHAPKVGAAGDEAAPDQVGASILVREAGAGQRGGARHAPARDERLGDSGDNGSGHGTAGPAESLRNRVNAHGGADGYRINPDDNLGSGGAKAKYADNIAAIKLLKELKADGRIEATREEQGVLVRYVGWGGLAQVFDPRNDKWANEYKELKELLSADEWAKARRSTQDAHYTSESVIRGIYQGLVRLGLKDGDPHILEPSAGIGNFIGLCPEGMQPVFTAVELDPTTSSISRYLYPQANHRNTGFQDSGLVAPCFDAVIGNPPFGNKGVYDPNFTNLRGFTIHNYFLAKSISLLREGGVGAFVVSRFFMDAVDPKVREHIAEYADFLGAVRLPDSAFRQNAMTDVVTDIVFFQKNTGEKRQGHEWTQTADILVNDFQREYPYLGDVIRRKCGEGLKGAASWHELHEILTRHGFELFEMGHELVIVEGKDFVKTSTVDRDLSKGQMEARLGHYQAKAAVTEESKGQMEERLAWCKKAVAVNQYFAAHPEQIIGRLNFPKHGGMFHDALTCTADPGLDLEREIAKRLDGLPTVYVHVEAKDRPKIEPRNQEFIGTTYFEKLKRGAYCLEPSGRIVCKVLGDDGKDSYDFVPLKSDTARRRMVSMIAVRDSLRELLNAERLDAYDEHLFDEQVLKPLRDRLNNQYDAHVELFGHLNSQTNRALMREDPESALLQALETGYDRGVSPETAKRQGRPARPPSAHKADIFHKRVLRPTRIAARAETAKDALIIALRESGRVNFGRMEQLLQRPGEEIRQELLAGGLIFQNPTSEAWEISDKYLSGNIRDKLRVAREAAQGNPAYQVNVDALAAVLPPDIEAVDIGVRFGSTWVPADVVADFIEHLHGGNGSQQVAYVPELGRWEAKVSFGTYSLNREVWGIPEYPAEELVVSLLTNRPIRVEKDTDQRDAHGKPVKMVDQEATAAAMAKADAIRQEFLDWVWLDDARREGLTRIYNDRFNTNVPPQY
ncbi:MAG: N-6 DNA methylase, partial [Deltaproteobacteria bacterium]|nr:N-6 DNA methylase [Deltaproteobacteria bacterium]